MQHRFDTTPRAEIPRSSFDRSHGYKTTFDADDLIPFYCDEALPGDTFNLKLTAFARLATPIKPIMDNMFMETFFFSVPVRQLWDNWEFFNGEEQTPGDSTDFLVPVTSVTTEGTTGSIFDYMGIPIDTTLTFDSLHLRAYNHIFNNWFRDQNLVTNVPLDTSDGPDSPALYSIKKRRKRPDYFTSCLPWPQKGDAIVVPIGDRAAVKPDLVLSDGVPTFTPTGAPTTEHDLSFLTDNIAANWSAPSVHGAGRGQWFEPSLYADLTGATGVSINDLRQSFQVQKIGERDARGGTRYPEILKSHFGVTDPQMLVLQRPEFLGGGSSRINVNPVEQTSTTAGDVETSDTPQGNLAAFGTVTLSGHGFTKSFTEHCILIGIVNVRADLTYQQGVERMWSRQTRFDYYWPALSHIGEQSVLNREIWAGGLGDPNDPLVFGYQERYAEYRYKPSLITGLFRSQATASLDVWHLSQDFSALPVLGETFIESNTPLDRTIAVPTEPHFLFDAFISLRCARPLPLYGTPGLIDHF